MNFPCIKDAMEFGKLEDIEDVNWKLPADDPAGPAFLAQHKNSEKLRVHYGAPVWGASVWSGKVYPEGTKRADYLAHYARFFNCIELNTVHYRIPNENTVAHWRGQVGPDFKFCPKVFQGISHTRHGLADREALKDWLHFLAQLGENGGPSFLQLPPYFGYEFKSELFSFLRAWPDEFPLALEFRHPSWFEAGKILAPLVQYLMSRQIGLVITDVAGRRDVLHASISAPYVLLRFIGNRLHPSDNERARDWMKRFMKWDELGLRELYLFVHQPDDVGVPELTEFFLNLFRREGGWHYAHPPVLPNQLSLLT